MKQVGIIIGSIRNGRKGESVGKWVLDTVNDSTASETASDPASDPASGQNNVTFSLIDLRDYQLPLLTDATPPGGADRTYANEAHQQWSRDIDACDAFIFVTPEYNHGVPGAFKNAYDSLGPEWQGKPVGFVSYGGVGGVRAVEQWRQIVGTFSMVDVAAQVTLSGFEEFDSNNRVQPNERRPKELGAIVEELRTRL